MTPSFQLYRGRFPKKNFDFDRAVENLTHGKCYGWMNLMNFLTPAAKLKLEFFHKCSDLAMYKHSSRVGGCLPLSEQCALSTVVLVITSMLFRIGRDRDVPNGNRETLKQLKDLQRASSFSSHVYRTPRLCLRSVSVRRLFIAWRKLDRKPMHGFWTGQDVC